MSRYLPICAVLFGCEAVRQRKSCFNAKAWHDDYMSNPPMKLCSGDYQFVKGVPGEPPKATGSEEWCFTADPRQRRSKTSQSRQDVVFTSLFDQKNLGTTDKQFIEFGFPDDTFETSYGNGRYLRNYMGFKEALLLDGSKENETIHLHKKFLMYENIVSIFDQYHAPMEADYVSIDIDSCDVWVAYALLKKYRPRVVTVEYNPRYPIGDFTALKCKDPAKYVWNGDDLSGAGLSAIELAARTRGYSLVHVEDKMDLFFVRDDLLCEGSAVPVEEFAYGTGHKMWLPYDGSQGSADELRTDFKAWLEQNPES